jgi:hypothetical protein
MRKFIERREKKLLKIVVVSYVVFFVLAIFNYLHILQGLGLI